MDRSFWYQSELLSNSIIDQVSTLVVVEGVGDLVHDEVGMPEEAMNAVVKINADIVLVFLKTEMAEVEVFQPVVVQLKSDSSLYRRWSTRSSD
jgi:hypothetical protein